LNTTAQLVAVTGATGQQGGATARHLISRGWHVRALTRDPTSEAACALSSAGAMLVAADFDDPLSLSTAFEGVHAVFSAQPSGRSAADEIRRGCAVADAAVAAGVEHFVFASVGGAERGSGVPTFEAKWAVEQHIAAVRLPATILRPTAFMENFIHFRLRDGALHTSTEPDVREQVIATDDIGAFAALAFDDPDEYIGHALELAGDELTAVEAAEAIGRTVGSTIEVIHRPPVKAVEALGDYIGASVARTPAWLREHGYQANIAALRRLHPELLDFDAWLVRVGTRRIARALGDRPA
jgi:uncharacterized protein YbjT (DUF2867 family)